MARVYQNPAAYSLQFRYGLVSRNGRAGGPTMSYPDAMRLWTRLALIPLPGVLLLTGCSQGQSNQAQPASSPASASASASATAGAPAPTPSSPSPSPTPKRASKATIVKRSTVPVLCWHQIRDFRASDSANDRVYITPPKLFAAQLEALAKAGYKSITPDELYDHLVYGAALPAKPVLLSLDDGWESEWVGAKPALDKHNMVATYFITTQGIDADTWVSSKQLRAMQAAGMTIADHTTSHGDARHYTSADWKFQLNKSLDKLSGITGAPVRYFAYPYGAWNEGAFKPLSKAGIKLAFQLTDKPVDKDYPLLTQRRMMINSSWSAAQTLSIMKSIFGEGKTRKTQY
jgi:peptidoglycan/xylan/chitin deacetylase (PgdA/CDA1 family)